MVAQLADLGIVARSGDQVAVSELGGMIAAMADLSAEFEDNKLDLVDIDALSLLSVCVEDEEMGPDEATAHLLAWTQARSATDAAGQLCEAMLGDDDPQLWALGLQALEMLEPTVAVPAVRRLRSHAGLGPVAADWLLRYGSPARRPRPR